MKRYIIIICCIFLSINLFATHNRAGQIIYEHISGYTYKITIMTYTYSKSDADRDTLTLSFGDGTHASVRRIQKLQLPDDYNENIYVTTHTFPGAGIFNLVVQDPNRNEGVQNIPNSVNVVFALKTTLTISPFFGHNSAPVLLNRPIDKAAVNKIFIHNPRAYDLDGDSLVYKMDTCRFTGGKKIPAFRLPRASHSIRVDAVSGDLIWDTPMEMGIYNVAMRIEEWRKGQIISNIIRDIQIEVEDTDNNPPEILEAEDICVVAGEKIEFDITAVDEDHDIVTLSAAGGPFMLSDSPAEFETKSAADSGTSHFVWQTNCSHIRQQDYLVTFRAVDNHPEVSLTDYYTVKIKVIGAPVQFTSVENSNTNVILKWDRHSCENLSGYKIYRRSSSENFVLEECQTGVPSEWGYTLIETLGDPDQTFYVDAHVSPGFNYCYRVVTVYGDDVNGITSDKECVEIAEGQPIIVKASVDTTDTEAGQTSVAWLKPLKFDTLEHKGPHRFLLQISRDLFGVNYADPIIFNSLDSLNFIDEMINTKDNPSCYKLMFQTYDSLYSKWTDIGYRCVASSPFLEIYSSDRRNILTLSQNVPWETEYNVFYRYNPDTELFDSIGFSNTNTFTDFNVVNLKEYCYKVKCVGRYTAEGMPKRLENMSQINCGTPIDTIPPCCPEFSVESKCKDYINVVKWQMPMDTCRDGVKKYEIFYTNRLDGEYERIVELSPQDTIFEHTGELSLSGCYYFAVTDSAGNVAECQDNRICVDNCNYYELPNIFTPNGDNVNDFFHPYPYNFVDRVECKIYDRWGVLVFETEDPDINWDGRDMNSGKLVSDGVYYYICDVYEYRLSGIEPRNISGFVHVYQDDEHDN